MFDAVAPAGEPGLLRFVTAGSVDDGKSTLIGRLLHDSKALMTDQVAAIAGARHARAAPGEIDLALVTDGLEAEREQGITIDVAYRYFATPARSFIIADAPGHEQYTRNMVTAASTADVAVVLIDASRIEGAALKAQTRRHTAVAALLGLKLIAAVNKMDLIGWDQGRFDAIADAMRALAATLGAQVLAIVPMSAKAGDNVVARSAAAPWYGGPSLSELLETAPARAEDASGPLRLPVQRVARVTGPDGAPLRGYQGRIAHGAIAVGDELAIAGRPELVTVTGLHVGADARSAAHAGLSVTVTLAQDVDLTRGDVLASPGAALTRNLTADLCWLDEDAWNPSVAYLVRQGALTTKAKITQVDWVRDVATLATVAAADGLRLNDIGQVRIATQAPLLADAYADLPATGSFVLINPLTRQTAAAGMIRAAA